MPTLILLFNHTLTPTQEADARASLGVGEIVEPPLAIARLWSQVPADAERIGPAIEPVFDWLAASACQGDFVLIQGEFGATWLAVRRAFELGLVPVYSTTSRRAVEEHQADGSVHIRHIFQHVRFRCYGD